MRIRSVTIEGFGPFKRKQQVDFSAFDADGLFLIAGETGVGKSSILDAIAYALYNKTPRWDNVSATGASNAVRSDFCAVDDPTQIVIEFETNGDEYRVTRSPEYDRPSRRSGGTAKQAAKILIEVLEGGTWVGKATKEREAADLIESLVKLNKDEFLQVIMLAQGRFQEFLLANSDQRLELLSKLFGTGRFADYQDRIAMRRSALYKRVELARTKRTMLLDGVDAPDDLGAAAAGDELGWLDRVIGRAATRVQGALRGVNGAEKAEKAALSQLDIARKQARAESAKQALLALGARREEIDQAIAVRRHAERAERVRPLLEDAEERREAWELATSDVEDARARCDGGVADGALPAEVSRLTEVIGTLTEGLHDEERAAQLQRSCAEKETDAEKLATAFAETTGSIERLQEERAALIPVAAQSQSAEDKVTRATERLTAATEAASIAEQLRKAQGAQLAADKLVTAARVTADDVLDRFLHGQAAVLAKKLIAGEPCPVCGSTAHPAPASFSDEPVAQEDVDAAQELLSRLEPEKNTAKEAVDRLRIQAAELAGAAGDGDVEALKAAVAQAHAELTASTGAGLRVGEIDEGLNGEEGLIARHKKLEDASKDALTELTKLTTESGSLAKKVARLRGEFPSVQARHASLVAQRDGAKELADAISALDDATKQRTSADAKLAAKVTKEGFDSAAEAESALLGEDAIDVLKDQIDTHAAAVSENEGILKQPDLQNLPDEIVTTDAATIAHRDAQRATHAATTEKANAESAHKSLEAMRGELEVLLSETAELVDEYTLLNRLSETVHGKVPNTLGMSLESYYIAAELEEVLASANVHLRTLSRARFEFRHTERGARRANVAAGLEIEIFDEYTGTARPPNQLSGGQQFLASLALALGLAEVVTSRAGGIELNTLFVDEGFGSLSTEYLEIAMETLDSLKQGGRTVGVISHVASMQEQIGAQLRVVAEPGGPSTILRGAA